MFRHITNLLAKLPFQLVFMYLFVLCCPNILTQEQKAFFYSVSLSIKSILVATLPALIFSCILSSIIRMKNNGVRVFIILILCICFSNFLSSWIGYFLGTWSSQHIVLPKAKTSLLTLEPLWNLPIKTILSNELSMIGGLIIGVCVNVFFEKKADKLNIYLQKFISFFLHSFLLPLVPVFAFGFIVKLQFDGYLTQKLSGYLSLISYLFACISTYIIMIYLIANRFRVKETLSCLREMISPFVFGFSSMSSMATMPLTLQAAQNNNKDSTYPQAIIPMTVNIHLVGDSMSIPIITFAIAQTVGVAPPEFYDFLFFSIFFVLAKFAVAAVPGGGMIVLLPVLEKHLHFTPEMLALMTSFYILLDPLMTALNVLGNSAFAHFLIRTCFQEPKKSYTSKSVVEDLSTHYVEH